MPDLTLQCPQHDISVGYIPGTLPPKLVRRGGISPGRPLKTQSPMKKVEAIVTALRGDGIKEVLERTGIAGFTLTQAHGFAPRLHASDHYRGAPNDREVAPEMKIEVVVEEPLVERAIEALQQLAEGGQIGESRVVVTPVENYLRIPAYV